MLTFWFLITSPVAVGVAADVQVDGLIQGLACMPMKIITKNKTKMLSHSLSVLYVSQGVFQVANIPR